MLLRSIRLAVPAARQCCCYSTVESSTSPVTVSRVNIDTVEEETLDKVIENERQLFNNIFKLYLRETHNESTIPQLISKKIISTTQSPVKGKRVQDLRLAVYDKTVEALKDTTIAYIESMANSQQVVVYFTEKMNMWKLVKKKDGNLNHLFKREATENERDMFVETMRDQPKESPLLNVFTLPIIANACIETLSTRLYDGLSAMSLFIGLKRDINLYSVACNQHTYNQVFKTMHLYYSKSDLFPIEQLFQEMRTNGFNGNQETFTILKQVLIGYYSMRTGQYPGINKESGVALWLAEDDHRANLLERELRALARRYTIGI